MKLTRRQLAAVLAASPAMAQTQPPATPPPSSSPDGELKAARDRLRTNGETLAQQAVPMATEPAFQFKA